VTTTDPAPGGDRTPTMTGPDHYRAAGELLALSAQASAGIDPVQASYVTQYLAAAQVHATLADAAATAALIPADGAGNDEIIVAWATAGAW
jgi:hypothetical protein